MAAILLNWQSYTSIISQMAKEITTTGNADVYVVLTSAGSQSSASSTLTSAGANMSRVKFRTQFTDSVWIRDYGPRYIFEGDCRAVVDHTYNRPRPNDDAFNAPWATWVGHAFYQLPLRHGGGNYHLDALNHSFATRLITNENVGLTEAQIIGYWQSYQNVDTHLFTPFPTSVDSTQHIDMWMQVIADDKVIISDWPLQSGSTQDGICDAAAVYMADQGYTVYRTPAYRSSTVHYTFTNVVMCNDLVLVPSFTNSTIVNNNYNATALATWQNALPGKTIKQINCEGMINAAGAMHCIAIHIPAPRGGVNPTAYLKTLRGGESLTPAATADIRWISDDDVAVTSINLDLSTDAGATFPISVAIETAADGQFTWTVPNLNTSHARLRVTARDASGNTGSDASPVSFSIGTGHPGDADGDGDVDDADTARFTACMFGPDLAPAPEAPDTPESCLELFDFDADNDVDLADALEYTVFYTQ
jgi:agmatine/peptidylarginine deiminase